MNLYNATSQKQRDYLKEADITILKDKDYNKEERNVIFNTLTSHIFSKSKKDISMELGKYDKFLDTIKQ